MKVAEMRNIACIAIFMHLFITTSAQCPGEQSLTFIRWSALSPEHGTPVFMYTASGDEESLVGACLARCRELAECSAVSVMYGSGNCHGLATAADQLKADNDVVYFTKLCLEVPPNCRDRWWSLEGTAGYSLQVEGGPKRSFPGITLQQCYQAVLSNQSGVPVRSAQWMGPELTITADGEIVTVPAEQTGTCVVIGEDRHSEPSAYRPTNHRAFYIENQCRHDYSKKIERCSYEEYFNQTLKHDDVIIQNYTKEGCKAACERETRFVCRGLSWSRGVCSLHSEDLVAGGSALLRRLPSATYYRRVVCLNISVECSNDDLVVTYHPRGAFRGRLYVPGRAEQCGAGAGSDGIVRLVLPLRGDCEVNFAFAISNGPYGTINRTMAYAMVMVQNNPIIQTAGDRWVRVGCAADGDTSRVHTAVAVTDTGGTYQSNDGGNNPWSVHAGASAVYNPDTSPLSMYIIRTEGGVEAGEAVTLGEPLELRVETTEEGEVEGYHLVASSRLGDSSVLLLDSRGCPTKQVEFPAFSRSRVGGIQRLWARFRAFRFPASHVVRFALMVRRCQDKCPPMNCEMYGRAARQTNASYARVDDVTMIGDDVAMRGEDVARSGGVVAQGGGACGGRATLELEMLVGGRDVMSADTLIHAEHQAGIDEPGTVNMAGISASGDNAVVCVHELVLVALGLAWLAVQMLLLAGGAVLVTRYRRLAAMSTHKQYQHFDDTGFDHGFDTLSTHRRVHWPDQSIDILHAH